MFILKLIIVALVITTAIFSIILNKQKKDWDEYSNVASNKEEIIRNIKILRNAIYSIIVVATVVLGILTSVFFTNEQEIGFTTMFGKNTMIEGAGMHFKVPFLSTKTVLDSTTKGMPIGYVEETDETAEEDSLMITSDFNFVNIDFYIEYRITDPIEYKYGSDDPEGILKNIAQSAIRNTIGQYDVDSVMTTGKAEIEGVVFDDIVTELTSHKLGLTIVSVTIQDAEPPTAEVRKAFKEVENEKQNAETAINKAHEYENTQIPAAEAKAEEIIQAANATKTERANSAKEEVKRFEALFAEYQNNPDTVKQRLYYEALEKILPNMEIIIGRDAKVIYVKDDANNTVGTGVATTQAVSEETSEKKD